MSGRRWISMRREDKIQHEGDAFIVTPGGWLITAHNGSIPFVTSPVGPNAGGCA